MQSCARCREESPILVTAARICLRCVQYLAECGGSWSSGDDAYASVIEQWIFENKGRFEHNESAQVA